MSSSATPVYDLDRALGVLRQAEGKDTFPFIPYRFSINDDEIRNLIHDLRPDGPTPFITVESVCGYPRRAKR